MSSLTRFHKHRYHIRKIPYKPRYGLNKRNICSYSICIICNYCIQKKYPLSKNIKMNAFKYNKTCGKYLTSSNGFRCNCRRCRIYRSNTMNVRMGNLSNNYCSMNKSARISYYDYCNS